MIAYLSRAGGGSRIEMPDAVINFTAVYDDPPEVFDGIMTMTEPATLIYYTVDIDPWTPPEGLWDLETVDDDGTHLAARIDIRKGQITTVKYFQPKSNSETHLVWWKATDPDAWWT